MRVLLTGWFSFLHGEATAGDLLGAQAVAAVLDAAGVAYDVAWSPVFRPGGLGLTQAAPERYTHLVFACGPVHGDQVAGLHVRYRSCRGSPSASAPPGLPRRRPTGSPCP